MLRGLFQFNCRFETKAVLPAFKGSVLRGAFGRALRQTCCTDSKIRCHHCHNNTSCLYPTIFDREVARVVSKGRGSPPAPYVIEPPETSQKIFDAGDPFRFYVQLFGEHNRSLPYVIYAMEKAGWMGLGAETDGARGRFRIESVKSAGQEVFSGDSKKFDPPVLLSAPDLKNASSYNGCRQLHINLQTPLRTKKENHFNDDLPFHDLVGASLRRISELHNHFGQGEPALDYAGLIQKAKSVEMVLNLLHWTDRTRFSSRQKTEMLFGGLVGQAVYEGDLGPFVPLLFYGAELHLGKQTTFGLGKLAITLLTQDRN